MHKNQKGIAEILMIIFVVLGIGLVGYYIYQNRQKPQTTDLQTIQTSKESTEDWETYTDPEGAYSYKYPADLIPNIEPPYGLTYFYPSSDLVGSGPMNAVFYIQVYAKNEPRETEYATLIQFVDDKGREWIIEKPILGEADSSNSAAGTKVGDKYYNVATQMYGRNLNKYLGREVFILKGSKVDVTLQLEEQERFMKQVLSTFEFTN